LGWEYRCREWILGKELGWYKRPISRLMPIKKQTSGLIEMELRNTNVRSMSLPKEVTVRFLGA
jgi:hypothetical protein